MDLPRVTICANRGPIAFRTEDSKLIAAPTGPNGLIPVVLPALQAAGGHWVYAVSSDDDRAANAAGIVDAEAERLLGKNVSLVAIDIAEKVRRLHYEMISVNHLAMAFHYLFPLPDEPLFPGEFDEAWSAYRSVNDAFASALAQTPADQPVCIQDYHLLLLPTALRSLGERSRRKILYFHHVAWCEPDYFGVLPADCRVEILESLERADVLGFHSERWARAYLACRERFLPSRSASAPKIVVAPATIRATEIAHGFDVADRMAELLRTAAGRWTLVRVDRADLWKNALRGFQAFGELLRRRPELAGKLWFLAVLSPTREWVPAYRDYLQRCRRAVEDINRKFAGPHDVKPVDLYVSQAKGPENRTTALAALRMADAVLINPIFDGLNIVGKEALAVSQRSPVLIASENCGVFDEAPNAMVRINPFSASDTARGIEAAYDMAAPLRQRMAALATEQLLRWEPPDWLRHQLDAI